MKTKADLMAEYAEKQLERDFTGAIPVLVCTSYRGVFFGWCTDVTTDPLDLLDARCAIHFGTTKGFMQLANSGPTSKSRIGARNDITLSGITAVAPVQPAAVKAWENA
jgi:hypothetical protein